MSEGFLFDSLVNGSVALVMLAWFMVREDRNNKTLKELTTAINNNTACIQKMNGIIARCEK